MSSINIMQAMRDTLDVALINSMPVKGDKNGLGLGDILTMHQSAKNRAMTDEPLTEAKLNRTLGWMQCAVVAACPEVDRAQMDYINQVNKKMYLEIETSALDDTIMERLSAKRL